MHARRYRMPDSRDRMPRESRSLRRTRDGSRAGRAAAGHRPSTADRRGSAKRSGPALSPRLLAPRVRLARGTTRRTRARERRAPLSTAQARCKPWHVRRALGRAAPAAPAPPSRGAGTRQRNAATRSFRPSGEDQQVLITEKIAPRLQLQPGAARVVDDALGIDPLFHRGTWPTAVLLEVDDADATVRLHRRREISQQRDRLLDLVICVDDQRRIERTFRQSRIDGGPEPRYHVAKSESLHASCDGLEHFLLDVLRVHAAIRSDACGEVNG